MTDTVRIIGIDVGVTTGLAVFESPDKVLHSISLAIHKDGPAGIANSLALAVTHYSATHIVIELPILSPQSPLYQSLLNMSNIIQQQAAGFEKIGLKLKIVRPVTWKATPAKRFWASEKPDHKMTIHERDAMRIAYWYYQFSGEIEHA